MSIACPLDRSLAESATHSCPRSSAGLAHGSVPSHFDHLPDRSLAMLLDVAEAGVLVCSRSCFLSGRTCGPGARYRSRAAHLLHRALAGESDVGTSPGGRARVAAFRILCWVQPGKGRHAS
jgi:hypothetical protein